MVKYKGGKWFVFEQEMTQRIQNKPVISPKTIGYDT